MNKAGSSTWQTLEYFIPTTGFNSGGGDITRSLDTRCFRGMFLDNAILTVDNLLLTFAQPQAVPEPSALLLAIASLLSWCMTRRRR